MQPRFPFAVLIRYRGVQLRNVLDQQLRDAPVRAFTIVILLVGVWVALHGLLTQVLRQVDRWELIAVVANQHIFVHLFLVLAVMLAFSNAILAFASLFGRDEAGYLLTLPVPARQAVCLKWLEGMLLSSWSFLLLGIPLMLAVAQNSDVAWYYYPLFIGHFLGFIIIPATFGLLAAWAVALWAPRRPLVIVLWCAGLVIVGGLLWVWKVVRNADSSNDWLREFYLQISLAKQPLLPSTWSAKGVVAAIEQRPHDSWLYLAAVLSTGAFFAWGVVNLIARNWPEAYSRAQQSRGRSLVRNGWATATACNVLFFYLPRRQRLMMLKDLRGFVRDPAQWTQMVIMMGLLVIYALNLKRLPVDFGQPGMRAGLAFLNLLTVSLILATFTSRFVFPLLSIESQQLWILGLLPTRRVTILLVKFIFSLTVTGLSGLLVMGLAVQALNLTADWAWLQIAVCLGICVGLSGLSVGTGARFPVLGQRNPARIAAGFGGTLNLILSMLFVAAEMGALALAGLSGFSGMGSPLERIYLANWLLPGMILIGALVAAVSLWVGARHFRRLEC